MRGKRAKAIRRQVFGDTLDRLEGRKYEAQLAPDTISGALARTGAVIAVGLRAEYQAAKQRA